MGVILVAAVAFGTFGAGVGMWMTGETKEVYADDLVNTVPDSESGTDPFYTNTITTGFKKNGYNTEAVNGHGYGPYKVSGVYQSQSITSATSFAAGLPLGTIFIDQSKISRYIGEFKIELKETDMLSNIISSGKLSLEEIAAVTGVEYDKVKRVSDELASSVC